MQDDARNEGSPETEQLTALSRVQRSGRVRARLELLVSYNSFIRGSAAAGHVAAVSWVELFFPSRHEVPARTSYRRSRRGRYYYYGLLGTVDARDSLSSLSARLVNQRTSSHDHRDPQPRVLDPLEFGRAKLSRIAGPRTFSPTDPIERPASFHGPATPTTKICSFLKFFFSCLSITLCAGGRSVPVVAETQKVREGVEEHNNIIEAVGTRLDHGKAPECGFRSPAEQLFDFWVAMLPPRRMKQRANTPSITDAGWFLEFSIPGERSGGARRIWRSQDHTGQLLNLLPCSYSTLLDYQRTAGPWRG
ncbi:hypothetical protein DTO195F2_6184 [Paecilomyces variotii]|nr:hypothetical protein DTO195F2_6184 [Paecilomyces variotii]